MEVGKPSVLHHRVQPDKDEVNSFGWVVSQEAKNLLDVSRGKGNDFVGAVNKVMRDREGCVDGSFGSVGWQSRGPRVDRWDSGFFGASRVGQSLAVERRQSSY